MELKETSTICKPHPHNFFLVSHVHSSLPHFEVHLSVTSPIPFCSADRIQCSISTCDWRCRTEWGTGSRDSTRWKRLAEAHAALFPGLHSKALEIQVERWGTGPTQFKELEFRGLKCVGKKIHDILFNTATPQEQAALLERFAGECELLGGLHHPCIVQFLGICFEQGSPLPVLVMEYLHTTLSACLERYGVLPEEFSYGILREVALGLRYLHEHSPPIIHRDPCPHSPPTLTSCHLSIPVPLLLYPPGPQA